MRMDKLTSQLQSALSDAQSLAVGRDHTQIEPVHLLVALLDQQGGSVKPLLRKARYDIVGLRKALDDELQKLAAIA
ncbi:MAG TPA: Clp protease N-terminal domain-containing protein, partial [Pseudomonadales bacterium]|nr:Clp protease N-terminal domain-containing protein [Pseudomonadales bacterium]